MSAQFKSLEPLDPRPISLVFSTGRLNAVILSYLTFRDLGNLSQCCRALNYNLSRWCLQQDSLAQLFPALMTNQSNNPHLVKAYRLGTDPTARGLNPFLWRSNFRSLGFVVKKITSIWTTINRIQFANQFLSQILLAPSPAISHSSPEILPSSSPLEEMSSSRQLLHGPDTILYSAVAIFSQAFTAGWEIQELQK